MTFWNITLTILAFLGAYYIGFVVGMIYAAYKVVQADKLKKDEQQLLEVIKRVKKIVEEDKTEDEQ